jgi:ABC-type protease/lipase transport system fused ATPase/permease subunit
VKPTPRLDAREFERLADLTRLGAKAREMARLTLVEGQSMHEVAKACGTIPQRVCLAVGSIHRVQASLTWGSSMAPATAVPDRLLVPLGEFIASFNALKSAQIDDAVIADLQTLLGEARKRIAGI